jgi:hypothetical protein
MFMRWNVRAMFLPGATDNRSNRAEADMKTARRCGRAVFQASSDAQRQARIKQQF